MTMNSTMVPEYKTDINKCFMGFDQVSKFIATLRKKEA